MAMTTTEAILDILERGYDLKVCKLHLDGGVYAVHTAQTTTHGADFDDTVARAYQRVLRKEHTR